MLIGERRALGSIVFVFFGLLYLLNGLVGPPPLAPMFVGMAAIYLVAFFGIVACWFWARWYAMGVALSGVAMGVLLAYQIGLEAFVIFYLASHGLAALMMFGHGPVSAYEGRRDWRERWKLDDNAVNRLGRSVTRAGASMPYLVLVTLAPRDQGLALAALGLGLAGLVGLVRLRTWALAALASSAAVVGVTAGFEVSFSPLDAMTIGLLVLAILPFAGPALRALRSDTLSSPEVPS